MNLGLGMRLQASRVGGRAVNGFRYSELLDTPGVTAGIWNRTGTINVAAVEGYQVLNDSNTTGFHYVNQVPNDTIVPAGAMMVTVRASADTASHMLIATNSAAQYVLANLSAGTLGAPAGAHNSAPTITPVVLGARTFYDVTVFVNRVAGNDVRIYVDGSGALSSYTGTGKQILIARTWVRPALPATLRYVTTTSAAVG